MQILNVLSVVVVVLFISFTNSEFPSNFQKCQRKDPNFNDCTLKAAQNGILQLTKSFPNLKLPSLNPLKVDQLPIGRGTDGAVALDMNFRNCELTDIFNVKFSKFKFNFENKSVRIELLAPKIDQYCDYELDGHVLVFPVKGRGRSTIIDSNNKTHKKSILINNKMTIDMKWEETPANDRTFLKIISTKLKMNPEHLDLHFDNLFDGDKTLGDNINKVVNDNWKEVYGDIADNLDKAYGLMLETLVNDFFSTLSMEEVFD